MSKNKKVMSIAIEPDLHDELKDYTKRKDMSISSYLSLLVSKGVKIPVDDDPLVLGKPTDKEVIPILLNVPVALKGDKEGLQTWMESQTAGIVAKLGV